MQRNESYCADTALPYKSTTGTACTPASRMHRGRNMVIGGTIISFFGIAVYCAPVFSSSLRGDPQTFVIEGLSIIGVGFAIWLVGAVAYLNAAIESGKEDSSF